MNKSLVLALLIALPAASCSAHFLSTPLEPLVPHTAPRTLTTGGTSIFAHVSETKGSSAFDTNGKKVAFLEQYGTSAIADLAKGLTEPAAGTPAYDYFNSSGTKQVTNKTASLGFDDPANSYKFRSLNLSATQHLFSGLFINATACLRASSITAKPMATGADATDANVVAFLEDFDAILEQYDSPALSNTKEYTLDHLSLHAGWAGTLHTPKGAIQEISGTFIGGYAVTQSDFSSPLAPTLLPRNSNDGFIIQFDGSARLFSHISINAHADATIFNRRSGETRIVRDDNTTASVTQNSATFPANLLPKNNTWYAGPLLLGSGTVKKDPGNLYNLRAAINLDRFFGFGLSVGYHFTYQEKTRLTLEDTTVLTELATRPALQNKRLNSDPKLTHWKHHAIVFGLHLGPAGTDYRWLPSLDASLACPFMGSNCVKADYIFGGSAALRAQWTF